MLPASQFITLLNTRFTFYMVQKPVYLHKQILSPRFMSPWHSMAKILMQDRGLQPHQVPLWDS